ncbi:MAG: spore coat protein [Clostridiales bacterium]|nr:spore coat protein [Clostridiales bacterium]
MKEKVMVNDTLVSINGDLVRYGEMISQTGNPQLKETLKQMRNQCEMSQEEIYQIAREKQYYVPAAPATQEEIAHVRSIVTQESAY